MTEAQVGLAKRALACKGWRWLPGMRTDSKFARVVAVDSDTGVSCASEEGATEDDCYAVWLDGVPVLPDLTDPATMGCLLALAREAWGMPTGITVTYSSDEGLWGVSWSGATHGGCCGRGETEGEALVAALESAP